MVGGHDKEARGFEKGRAAGCSGKKVEESVRWVVYVAVMRRRKVARHKEGNDCRKYMHIYYDVTGLRAGLQ